MLYRKISTDIEAHLRSGSDKIMVIEGARQIGKSYIIREVGKRLYKNFVEVNFAKDDETEGLFRDIRGLGEFYITLREVSACRRHAGCCQHLYGYSQHRQGS